MSTATTAPRHVRPSRLARLLGREDRRPASAAREPGDGRGLADAIADVPEMPWPPLPALPLPAPAGPVSLASLRRIADGLRALDGPAAGSRDYREVRSHLRTEPFQAVQADETPGRPARCPGPRAAAVLTPRPLPGLAADLADLPAFREAVSRRTRDHARQCMCGNGLPGDGWGDRMVAAGTHLLGGAA